MFRPLEMQCYSLVLSDQSHWEVANTLGEVGVAHFINENSDQPSISGEFYPSVRRCEESLRKLEDIKKQMEAHGARTTKCQSPKDYLRHLNAQMKLRSAPEFTYFEEVESLIEENHGRLMEQLRSYSSLQETINGFQEHLYTLKMVKNFFPPQQEEDATAASPLFPMNLTNLDSESEEQSSKMTSNGLMFIYIAGVIETKDVMQLKKIVFRATRGNALTVTADIHYDKDEKGQVLNALRDPETGKVQAKSVFLFIYAGNDKDSKGNIMRQKVYRIIDALGGKRYPVPGDTARFPQKVRQIEAEMKTQVEIQQRTEKLINEVLLKFSLPSNGLAFSLSEELGMFLTKEKQIFVYLNFLKRKDRFLAGRIWVPVNKEKVLLDAVSNIGSKELGMPAVQLKPIQNWKELGMTPPTALPTNEFTLPFQEIINLYGFPRYREINPAFFTVITFPFLFGIMFGDIGHGLIFFLFSLYVVLFSDSIKANPNSLFQALVPSRYILLLMGFFAFYCGFIYNDFMSIPTSLFPSCYGPKGGEKLDAECVYPFGVDPIWTLSKSYIAFIDSFKMKMAVILGVLHMILGILMKGLNSLLSCNCLDFLLDFVPQIVFFTCLLGYMLFCIFYKWSMGWPEGQGPAIITLFINLPQAWDVNNPASKAFPVLFGDPEGQMEHSVELFILYVALSMVPIMLLGKPVMLALLGLCKPKPIHPHQVQDAPSQQKDKIEMVSVHSMSPRTSAPKEKDSKLIIDNSAIGSISLLDDQDDSKTWSKFFDIKKPSHEESLTELFLHQGIETIEFVLGTISNTASYLRLWALSLAHSQLAAVFYEQTIGSALLLPAPLGPLLLIVGFLAFMLATLLILLLMDVMECFLHALRLHWVEFQNKFYKGDGYEFQPLNFENAIFSAGSNQSESAQ